MVRRSFSRRGVSAKCPIQAVVDLKKPLWGLGFRVWSSGFKVWSSGLRVWSSGFRVWGLGFEVEGFGGRVWCLGVGFKVYRCLRTSGEFRVEGKSVAL